MLTNPVATPVSPSDRGVQWEHLPAGRHFLVPAPPERWDLVFARVSTSDQVRDGWSLSQQIEAGIELGRRQGKPVTAVYVDPGKSATRLTFDQRAGVRTLLEDIRRGLVGTVYVYKRDRVARQSGEWLLFLKTCLKHKVRVEFTCPHEPPIGQGIYGKFQEAFMSIWAELEAEQIRIRIRDSVMNRFQNGQWIGGRLPFGLARDDRAAIIPHEGEAPIVREIYRLALQEGLGADRIARRLNQEKPLSRRGFSWTRYAVLQVLKSRVYCGYLSLTTTDGDDGQPVRLEQACPNIPPLIDEADWAEMERRRRERTRRKGAVPTPYAESPNLLAGLLCCGKCGRPLASRHFVRRYTNKNGEVSTYRVRRYYCPGRSGAGCGVKIGKEEVEEAVLRACFEALSGLGEQGIRQIAAEYRRSQQVELQTEIGAMRRELGRIDSALSRNQVALERVGSPDEAAFYRARIAELLGQQQAHRGRIDALATTNRAPVTPPDLATELTWEGFLTRFHAAPQGLRRLFFTEGIEQVSVNPGDNGLSISFRCGSSMQA